MINDIKVLVVSVSSWNSKVGMNTWPALLENFNPDNVANICLREEHPDSEVCNNYFVISENKVIKSVLKRSLKTGRRVERTETDYNNTDLTHHNARYAKMKKHRGFFTLMARETLWKLGKWKTPELYSFVKDFSPDVILYSMDGYIHLNRICKYVKRISGAKSIGFFADDNFTYKQSKNVGHNSFRFFQRKSLKSLARVTDGFWAITEKTKQEADAFFGVNCTVVTKPMRKAADFAPWNIREPIKIIYTGNLGIGRDKSLVKCCEAAGQFPEGTFIIDVYTKTLLSKSITSKIDAHLCTIHPPISQSEVLKLQSESDVLLFLEATDGADARIARLSFSTKITDYLSCGRCIFAIGCDDTAPIEYFRKNESAIVATDTAQILDALRVLAGNHDIILKYAERACESGIKNHKKENILAIVERTIREIL